MAHTRPPGRPIQGGQRGVKKTGTTPSTTLPFFADVKHKQMTLYFSPPSMETFCLGANLEICAICKATRWHTRKMQMQSWSDHQLEDLLEDLLYTCSGGEGLPRFSFLFQITPPFLRQNSEIFDSFNAAQGRRETVGYFFRNTSNRRNRPIFLKQTTKSKSRDYKRGLTLKLLDILTFCGLEISKRAAPR